MKGTNVGPEFLHDLRRPLSMMRVFLETLANIEDLESLVELRSVLLDEVRQALDQSSRMIDDSLNPKACVEEFDLGMLVKSVAKREASTVNASFAIECEVPEDATLESDRVRVERAIANVVGNACEACTSISRLSLKLKRGRRGDYFLMVRNSGRFLSQKMIETILKGFRNPEKEGSHGIGVLSAQAQMKLIGGKMRLWSRKGRNDSESFVEVVLKFPTVALLG